MVCTSISLPVIFTNGLPLPASSLNSDFQTIYNDYNGHITDVNIDPAAAIALSKLNLTTLALDLLASGNPAWAAGVTGDAQPRVALLSQGAVGFGPGGGAVMDTLLKRSAASTLAIRNLADSAYGTLNAVTQSFGAASDANPVVQVGPTGIKFGLGGASALITLLKNHSAGFGLDVRNAADSQWGDVNVGNLYANSSVQCTGGISISGNLSASGQVGGSLAGSSFVTAASAANNNGFARFVNTADGTGGVLVSNKVFVSTDQTITSAVALTLAHGLTYQPLFIGAFLVCQTGELGYTAGDVVAQGLGAMQSSSVSNTGVSVVPDATNLVIRFGSNATTFSIIRKDTGAAAQATNANWKIRFVAF